MATADEIKRITRRSEALKSLSLGDAPQLDQAAFHRFPEEQAAVVRFNSDQKKAWDRIKNMMAEALLAARDVTP